MRPPLHRTARGVYEGHAGPNMTPMVDVVMVILVFFMASSAVLGPEWFLRAALPREGAASPAPERPPPTLRVALVREGGVTVARAEGLPEAGAGIEALGALLAARASADGAAELIVVLRPAPDVPYDDVVRVHEACARLGIERVALATDAPGATPAAPVIGP